jgi:uncharacterized protein (UPF0261 family)
MQAIGTLLAERVNAAKGPCVVVLPRGGFSIGSSPGGTLHDPEADARFVAALRETLSPRIPLVEVDAHANSAACADVAMQQFLAIRGRR